MLSVSEFDRLGSLVAAVGTRDFGGIFYRFFRDMVNAEQCSALAFSGDARPEAIVIEGQRGNAHKIARRLTRDYLLEGYEHDTNWRLRQRYGNGVHIVTPDDVIDPAFRDHYYDQPGIDCELVLLGNFRNVFYYVSFYRSKSQVRFDRDDADLVHTMSGLIVKILHRHRMALIGEHDTKNETEPSESEARIKTSHLSRDDALSRLRDALLKERNAVSRREAEICASIALGYSSHAIGWKFNISINTVLTHRKRAYAKLGISSQSELFSLYLGMLKQI